MFKILMLIREILGLLKDSDGDGIADVFDKHPNDPNKK